MLLVASIAGLTSGWLLAAAAAAAAVVVIHLRARRKPLLFVFPTARFARIAAAGLLRKRRVRDLVLLSLRAAAAMFLAIAFSRPLWRPDDVRASAGHRGVAAVIILDASASMQRHADGAPLFNGARERAAALLDRLDPATDRAALILLDGSSDAVLPELSANVAPLVHALAATSCTSEKGDPAAAVALASGLFNNHAARGLRRAVIVLSDMQASQWRGVVLPAAPKIEWRFESFGGPEDPNLAVTDLRVSPSRPRTHRPFRATATIGNFSIDPRAIAVRFFLDSAPIGEALIDVPAWSERDAAVTLSHAIEGSTTLTASIEDPGFEWDNTCRAGVEFVDALPAWLVTARDARSDPTCASWFLRAAVEAVDTLAPRILTPDELAALSPDAGTLVIADAGALSERHLRAAERIARAGGTVLWFVEASQPALTSHATGDTSLPVSLLVDRPAGIAHARPARDALEAAPDDALAQALRMWSDERVPLTIASSIQPGSATLLESSSGPILARRAVGAGFMTMCTIDLAPARSNFVRQPVFPALIHALIASAQNASAGGLSTFVGGMAPGAEATLDHPGVLTFADSASGSARIVGVNLHPHETDLRPLPAGDFPRSPDAQDAADPAADDDAIPRPPVELWPWCIAAAMMLLIAEGALRQRPRRAA